MPLNPRCIVRYLMSNECLWLGTSLLFSYETSFTMCLFVGTREADEAAGVCDEEA